MAYITVKDLEPGYEGQPVTDKINFQVNKGDYLCIVGENGAGKSTLMKTILHLIKPLSGTISYGDGLEEYEIGYLPQQSFVQKDFPASVWEVALSGNLAKLGRRPFYSAAEKKNTRERLEELGIWGLRNKCYRDLSGGQQQRVLLARALCATTKLLLLDEPVSGLDPKVTTELYRLIRKLNQSGVTILMVTHDVQVALEEATHILHIGDNRELFFGTKEKYLESSAWKSFGLKEDK
jgi:zinc transport system ATP-binding protein